MKVASLLLHTTHSDRASFVGKLVPLISGDARVGSKLLKRERKGAIRRDREREREGEETDSPLAMGTFSSEEVHSRCSFRCRFGSFSTMGTLEGAATVARIYESLCNFGVVSCL